MVYVDAICRYAFNSGAIPLDGCAAMRCDSSPAASALIWNSDTWLHMKDLGACLMELNGVRRCYAEGCIQFWGDCMRSFLLYELRQCVHLRHLPWWRN